MPILGSSTEKAPAHTAVTINEPGNRFEREADAVAVPERVPADCET
jgi:hypothetical protein